MDCANQNELNHRTKSDKIRIIRAIVFSTWMYGMLFLVYILSRLIFTPTWAHLNDYFITGIPFFTFYRTALIMLIISIISLIICTATKYSKRPHYESNTRRESEIIPAFRFGKQTAEPNGDIFCDEVLSDTLKIMRITSLIMWILSTSIWAYISYLILTNPSTLPHWHIGMIMFVLSFFSMMIYCATRDSSKSRFV